MFTLERQMADRQSAPELRSYGLRGFLLAQYDMVMRAQAAVELRLARQVAATTALGGVISGVGLASCGSCWGGCWPPTRFPCGRRDLCGGGPDRAAGIGEPDLSA